MLHALYSKVSWCGSGSWPPGNLNWNTMSWLSWKHLPAGAGACGWGEESGRPGFARCRCNQLPTTYKEASFASLSFFVPIVTFTTSPEQLKEHISENIWVQRHKSALSTLCFCFSCCCACSPLWFPPFRRLWSLSSLSWAWRFDTSSSCLSTSSLASWAPWSMAFVMSSSGSTGPDTYPVTNTAWLCSGWRHRKWTLRWNNQGTSAQPDHSLLHTNSPLCDHCFTCLSCIHGWIDLNNINNN